MADTYFTRRNCLSYFRIASISQPGQEFDRLKATIEEFSLRNAGLPVVLVSISMGAPFTALFLAKTTSAAWRQRYLARHVSIR